MSRGLLPGLLLVVVGCAAAPPPPPASLRGVWQPVAAGDTLAALAAQHGADPDEVSEINGLTDGSLDGRTEVFIPTADGRAPGTGAPPPPPRNTAAPSAATAAAPTTPPARCGEEGRPCLTWPVQGPILTRFGNAGAPHDGLDIGAPSGSPVLAAAAGEVVHSGDELQGYGNLIIVKHEGGLLTVYAHNAENLVKSGQKVAAAETIAKVGATGAARQPHLHFEVRRGQSPQDPLGYLPDPATTMAPTTGKED